MERQKNKEIVIRPATPDDAAALLKIYAPYVTDTAITFEYEIPSVEEFQRRIREIHARYPYLLASKDGKVVGYCPTPALLESGRAYARSAETVLYIDRDTEGTESAPCFIGS